MKTLMLVVTVLICSGTAFAGEGNHTAAKSSKELEKLKALEGTWKGSMIEGGKPVDLTVKYDLTSGGTAVVETISPGEPHEMVSVYHDENGKLTMTHYCMLGNQPKLSLKSSKPNQLDLSFSENNVLNPQSEHHMHALEMVFIDENTLVERWSSMQNGKMTDAPTVFKLTRVQ